MKKLLLISFIFLFSFNNNLFANSIFDFNEDKIEDSWTIGILEIGNKFLVSASVNGKFTHGDRLTIFFSSKDCEIVNLTTRFLSEVNNPDIYTLDQKLISAKFRDLDIKVKINGIMNFFNNHGHILLLDINRMKVDKLKDFFKGYSEVKLMLKNDENINLLQYLVRKQNIWSLRGFESAMERGKIACNTNNKF